MKFNIITIFPQIFDSYLNESILKRARERKLINIKVHNLRDFTIDKHRKVDDRPFGGGPGMVMQVQPIIKAIEFAKGKSRKEKAKKKTMAIIFSASGKQFDDKTAKELAKNDQLILICGHYEGIDERTKKVLQDSSFKIQEISIGPYVLTGGELPAMILIDSVSRKIPGVLGKEESLEEKRHGIGVPVYTRPAEFPWPIFNKKSKAYKSKNYKVPKVLLSGDHKKIEEWRRKNKK